MTDTRGCNIPEDLYYWIEKHAWAREDGSGELTVGITDVAQHLAARVVAITTKKVGKVLERGQSVATVESGKWVGPVPTPVDGEVTAVNPDLAVRSDPRQQRSLRGRLDREDPALELGRPEGRARERARRHRGLRRVPRRGGHQLRMMFEPVNGVVHRGCMIPLDRWYDVPRDVWLRPEGDGSLLMGMTDVAQTRAGKVLHIQFKKVGRRIEAGQSAATIETAKWAGPFPTPIGGTVLETNADAFAADILVANRDPYELGWLVRLEPDAWDPASVGLVTGPAAVSRYEERIEALGVSCIRCAD